MLRMRRKFRSLGCICWVMRKCGGEQNLKGMQSQEGPNHHLGDSKAGTKGGVPPHQCGMAGSGVFEKT